jgi:hypothetical protein
MEANEARERRLRSLGWSVEGVTERVDLGGRVERNPYRTVALALGAGYLLGGGATAPVTGRALGLGFRLGLRMVVLPLLAERLVELARDALADAPEGPSSTRSRNGGTSQGAGRI